MNAVLNQGKERLDSTTGEVIRLELKRNTLKVAHSVQDARSISRSYRYRLQNQAGNTLNGERVCKCCKVNVDSTVSVFKTSHSDGSSSSHYSGLMFCGSVWHCPVCGAKISERRSHELREAFEAAKDQGYHIAHLTFTFPHKRTDDLSSNLSAFLDAFKKFWDSAPMRRFKEKYGLMGRIRALETTWSNKNGFHPHIHLLTFTSVRFDDLKGIRSELLGIWNDKLKRVGLGAANRHGISIQNGDHAGEYINKFADDSKLTKSGDAVTWDMADEMTKLNSKSGNSNSLTPFDFLRIIDSPESYGYKPKDVPFFKRLFKEYATSFKGRSQLEWGRGSMNVRKNLGLTDAKTDDELVNEIEEKADKVLSMPPRVYSRLLPKRSNGYTDLRAIFLTICETKPLQDVQNFLHKVTFPDITKSDFLSLLRLGNYHFNESHKDLTSDFVNTRTIIYDHEKQSYEHWLRSHALN